MLIFIYNVVELHNYYFLCFTTYNNLSLRPVVLFIVITPNDNLKPKYYITINLLWLGTCVRQIKLKINRVHEKNLHERFSVPSCVNVWRTYDTTQYWNKRKYCFKIYSFKIGRSFFVALLILLRISQKQQQSMF